jgi:GWxTD domain-containing protein
MLRSSRVAVLALAVFCLLPSATGQKRKDGLSAQNAKWLEEEVPYIITEEERKAFLRLSDDKARDQFIEDFWAIRNPVRSSGPNPYKEEHDRRIEYANEHFGRQSNITGWRTDMGRAWILFGKPVSQARFIAGGQLYPCELWFYSNTTGDPALPPFFYLLFYMPGDIGEYRFYRPYLDGPMQLVRGSQFNSNKSVYDFLSNYGADLARAAFTLVPGDPIDTDQFTVTMTGDMLVSRIQNLANDSYNVNRIRQLRELHESVRSFFLVADQRPLDLSSIVVTDPAGQAWVDYSVAIDVPELGVPAADGKALTVASSYRLRNESGDVIVEDAQQRAYPAFEAADGQTRFIPFQVANRLPLAPGKYRLEVELHQRQSGKSFRGFQNLVVGGNSASVSGPLLVNAVEPAAHPDGATPFQYFGSQFHPAARRQFTAESSLRVLLELAVPSPAADYEVEYVLANTQLRDARRSLVQIVHGSQFRNGRLFLSKALLLTGLPDGEYRIVVNLRAASHRETVEASSNAGFHLGPNTSDAALYFDSNAHEVTKPGVAPYIRALCAQAQKDPQATTAYLRQAVDQNPGNIYADTNLVDLFYHSRRFADITRLYDRLGMKPFENSAESLAQISLSLWDQGQADRARDVLRFAQATFPGNPLVEAVKKSVR